MIKQLIKVYRHIWKNDFINEIKIQKHFRNCKDNKKIQWERLERLLKHAYGNSLFYQNIFKKNGITPQNINNYIDFRKIPITNKRIFKENFNQITVNSLIDGDEFVTCTSGSTGEPFEFYQHKNMKKSINASFEITREYWGIEPFNKYNTLIVKRLHYDHKPQSKIKDFLRGKNIRIEAHNLNPDNLDNIIELIKRENINILYGFSSSLLIIARHVERKGIKLNIDFIITIGEGLTESEKKFLTKQFNTKVRRDYGASECMRMGFESNINSGYYYLDTYNYYFEFLPQKYSNKYTLVVTNLNNYIFPVIRYEIGDEIELPSKNIDREYNLPLVKVLGRKVETVILPNGKELTVHFFTYLFEYLSEYVKNFKITQTSSDSLVIEVVQRNKITKEITDLISKKIKNYAKCDIFIHIKIVKNINLESSGKRRLLIPLEV